MRSESSPTPDQQAQDAAHDQPYTFGRPTLTYLSVREVVRLTILHSKLGDRAAAAGSPRD
jgi:hypothetical protein